MKLQLALDMVTSERACEILRQVHEVIDIVEVGTPLIVHEGMAALRRTQQVPAEGSWVPLSYLPAD